MKITLTQEAAGIAVGATAVLHLNLGADVPPMDAAPLVAVAAGAWAKVTLGPGLAITAGVLDIAGDGSGYVLPAATAELRGGVTVGANLTLTGDTISLGKANVLGALGFTPVDSEGAASAAPVQSVAGRTGLVTLGTADISGFTAAAAAAAPVQSVAGRTGAVTLSAGDVAGLSKVATSGSYNDLADTPPGGGGIDIPAAGLVESTGTVLSPVTVTGGLALAAAVLQRSTGINTQAGNYTLAASDNGKIVCYAGSSASTITLDGSGLFAGWSTILKHIGTGSTAAAKTLSIAGTLDGHTNPAVYPGDTRIITWDGTAFASILVAGGYLEIRASDSPFVFKHPPGATATVQLWGGGAGAGSGRRGAAGTARVGGSAGGGGNYNERTFPPAQLGTGSTTITVAAPAAGGAAVTTNDTNGSPGTVGNNTTFGTLLVAYGGGAGAGGALASISGGSGASTSGAGTAGTTSAVTAPGGSPSGNGGGHFAGGASPTAGAGQPSTGWGGAAGGASGVTGIGAGGSAVWSGAGGGGGGSINTSNVPQTSAAGGAQAGIAGGGAGAAGLSGGPGGDGTAGPTEAGPGGGGGGGSSGGGGGGGGAGGDGGIASGGGGGAASLNGTNSGPGGDGGAGLARVRY